MQSSEAQDDGLRADVTTHADTPSVEDTDDDAAASDTAVDEPPAADTYSPEPRPQLGCGTGNRALPEGLITLSWDDGTGETDLFADHDASFDFGAGRVLLSGQRVHEAVRFELEHPTRVHGFSVQWTGVPTDATSDARLEAAIYADFGANGRDFWHEAPLWSGTRCAEDLTAGEWLTYVPEEPVILQPGLVFVGHGRAPGEAGLLIDSTGAAPEWWVVDELWEAYSSINFPDAGRYEHEITLQATMHFMVRLHVEHFGEVSAEETLFAAREGPASNRASWGDIDTDGLDDLLSGSTLYRNEGGGDFVDITEAAGLVGETISGGVFGDFDNDGCLDLFAFAESTRARDSLWRGDCSGGFINVTDAAGLSDAAPEPFCEGQPEQSHLPSPAASWLDLNADGFLDLYVVGFICWTDVTFYPDQIFENRGDGTFEDVSLARGFGGVRLAGRGASPIDHDRDGDVDLLVNNYRLHRNLFFDNQGDGHVREVGEALGLAGVPTEHSFRQTYFGHTIGTAWGDLDNDGDFDVVQANLAHPRFFWFSDKTQVLVQTDEGWFADLAGPWGAPMGGHGIRYSETHSVPALADFDHDGDLDLVLSAIYERRPTDFLWGDGDGTFTSDAYRAGLGVEDGWGLGVSDWDNDGDPDLAYSGLWENVRAADGAWLQVRVVGDDGSNRAALGATVEVRAGERTWIRHVQGGTGQGNQDSMYLHFGLGSAASVDAIAVELPGGKRVEYRGPWEADRRLWVYESGRVTEGWGP